MVLRFVIWFSLAVLVGVAVLGGLFAGVGNYIAVWLCLVVVVWVLGFVWGFLVVALRGL